VWHKSSQSTTISTARTRATAASAGTNPDNSVYIDQAGDSNTVEILQDGTSGNHVRGIGVDNSSLVGDTNVIDIKQGAGTGSAGINLIELMVAGDRNELTLFQDRNNDGTADSDPSGDHIIKLDVDGDDNAVQIIQHSNSGGVSGHFADIELTGNSNLIDVNQSDTNGSTLFSNINGNSNTLDVIQKGNGSQFADITLTGNGHTVDLTQQGAGDHNATIDLTFGSAASSLTLDQAGSTDKSYSLEQTCYTVGGCSATVTQYD